MKTSVKFLLCLVCAFVGAAKTHAAQSERAISITLSGYLQGQDLLGDDKAISFRYTTKEILNEIGFYSGMDLTKGTLLLIDSLTDTNAPSRIVARNAINEVDVSELFQFNQGEGIQSSKYLGNVLKSATIYSVDFFEFQTLNTDTNGYALQMQLFSKETQRALLKKIGTEQFNVVTATLAFDGNGELVDQFGLIGPLKGTIKIGAPKYVP